MNYLTLKEVAELKGCSWQNIQRLVKDNKLDFIQELSCKGKMKYMIPVSALSEDLQIKYYKKLKGEMNMPEPKAKAQKITRKYTKSFEELSASERETVNFWCELLQEWQSRRSQYISKVEFDKNFVGECRLRYDDVKISTDILYRKWNAYKENNYEGLIDNRGGWNKGCSTVPEPVWDAFLWYWLDENKPTVSLCYRDTIEWANEFYPELTSQIPSEMAFRRKIKSDVTVALKTLMRDGEKAFNDRCTPYISRMYDKLEANDCWIADNHTFDIISYDGEKTHRLYLTAFLDAKSGVITGWNITTSPDSQSTVLALRHGIMRFGIPKCIYVDNGREFLVRDVGGQGHRTHKGAIAEIDPPTIFKRLGIEMRNAIVRNAKAKPVERTFYTVKNQFSKLFSGFCGGTILERPESLKRRIKNGNLPCDYQVRETLDAWIDGEYNLQQYGGSETTFKGLSRLDVWNKTCTSVRKANPDDLNLMLMRTSRKQKIKRNGVYITFAGEKIWYMNQAETINNLEKEVYVRYDPADLRTARIYDAITDKPLFTWELADKLMVDYLSELKEDVADAQAFIKESKKFVREQAKGIANNLSNEQKITMLDMTVRKARANKADNFNIIMPKNIVPVIANEDIEDSKMASGGETAVKIDFKKIRENSKLRKG